jgi:Xaa-Pro aminopeptidase
MNEQSITRTRLRKSMEEVECLVEAGRIADLAIVEAVAFC